MPENREYFVQLVKSLQKIEKAIGNNDTAAVLRALLTKLDAITLSGKGDKGDDGKTPVKGKDYRDGKDGRGIVRVELNAKDELTILFSDGKETNLGSIRGPKGKDPDQAAIVREVLKGIQLPTVDTDAIVQEVLSRVKPATPEQIAAAIKKDIAYDDLKDKPDLVELIKKYTAHLGPQERGVYAAPGAGAGITVLDEGIVIAEAVKSIDFRGAAVSVTDLGDGNIVVTVNGGGASVATEVAAAVQSGTDVTIDLTQLANVFGTIQWVSRNGQILIPGPEDPAGVSSWEVAGDVLTVHWADAGDSFQVSYTY